VAFLLNPLISNVSGGGLQLRLPLTALRPVSILSTTTAAATSSTSVVHQLLPTSAAATTTTTTTSPIGISCTPQQHLVIGPSGQQLSLVTAVAGHASGQLSLATAVAGHPSGQLNLTTAVAGSGQLCQATNVAGHPSTQQLNFVTAAAGHPSGQLNLVSAAAGHHSGQFNLVTAVAGHPSGQLLVTAVAGGTSSMPQLKQLIVSTASVYGTGFSSSSSGSATNCSVDGVGGMLVAKTAAGGASGRLGREDEGTIGDKSRPALINFITDSGSFTLTKFIERDSTPRQYIFQ
jgi:hypothetical protein